MRLALNEAARGMGRTSPNPPVGCVIVRDGQVVGRGFHPRAGEPHAEVFALREAGEYARGATAYVTLEPCSHFGRTPPCADALVAAGVSQVVIAALDPNPRVGGQGASRLREAGIEVIVGVAEEEALRQQAGFRSLVMRARPWVIYKYAMTLDGKVAALDASGRGEANGLVTGLASRARVMAWRNEVDGIAVGSGTVITDDPLLTTRGVEGGRDPRPVVFDGQGRTSASARVIRPGAVVVTAPGMDMSRHEAAGAQVIYATQPSEALAELGRLNFSTLFVEGGPTLAGSLLDAGLVDEVRAFVAPKLLGAGLNPLTAPVRPMHEAQVLRDVTFESLGPDLLIRGLLNDIPRLNVQGAN
nr:bifunctional diaminohydroxyphosphoribosylaminopyrimidine deaminase/5-amino-6-(5-phosphoribosylamino)uracil reductase RibD [Deinococcus deserti]